MAQNEVIATNTVPEGAPGPASQGSPAGNLRKLLRAKIGAVLKGNITVQESKAACDRALQTWKARYQEFLAAAELPASEDQEQAKAHLNEAQQRYQVVLEAGKSYCESILIANEAEQDWNGSKAELVAAIQESEKSALLAQDDVYLAAMRMNAIAPVQAATGMLPPELPPQVELDEEQNRLLLALQEAAIEAALLLSRVKEAAPHIKSAVAAVNKSWRPAVKPPVRPTEEEVQRYLRQTEAATVDRHRAHLAVVPLLAVRQKLLSQLQPCQEKLSAARIAIEAMAKLAAVVPLATVAANLDKGLNSVQATLGDGLDVSHLDTLNRPTASARETRRMRELRELMRDLALAMARHNEAEVALTAAKAVPQAVCAMHGVAQNKSWQDCVSWRAEKAQEQAEVDRKNLSRQTKIDLLSESVKQYESDCANGKTALHRYTVAVAEPGARPPGDELRALLNAAAWMYNPDVRYEDKSTGEFPIY